MGLFKSLSKYNDTLQKQANQYAGILGLSIDGSRKVNVPSRAGFVYVRLRDNLSEVVQAYNDKVSPVYDLAVIIQRSGNRWVVVSKDTNRYETWGTSAPFLPAHGSQHSFNRDVGTGGDTVWVYPDQFMPLLVYPSGTAGSTNLMVAPYLLKREDDFIYAGNTGTQNLLTYKPTNTDAILGLVVLNTETGNPEILIASGTPLSASVTGTSGIAPYLPYPASNQEPLYAFRLVSGTSYLTWDNLYNTRQFIGGSSVASTGSSGGGDPAGSDRDVQFNNAGVFGADDEFIYQNDVKSLGLGQYDLMPYDTTKLFWNVGDNISPGMFGLAYGSTRAPFLGFAKADGTGTVPTNVKADQAIGRIRGYGYDGGSWSGVQAEITLIASGDWITGAYTPTRFDFDVTPSGSATKRTQFQIHGDSVNIPTGSTYNIGGIPHTHPEYSTGTSSGGGSSDGWTPDLNTWSYSSGVRSQAYTNDPAAGSNIQLNMADTSNFQVGSKVTVSSSAGSETVYITEVSTNTYIKVDVLALNHTTTSPLVTLIPFVFVISINADMTSVLQVKDRVSFIQDATQKYAIVHAVGSYSSGATLITIYTGETYELTTSAISTPKYSHIANPLGFPQNRDIWDYVFSCSRASSKVSPSAGTWYGGTLLSDTGSAIALPIGAWLVDYCAPIYGNKASTTQYTVKATLSTANNTEVYPDTTIIAKSGGASGTISIFLTQTREKYFSVSSPTTLYVNVATPASGGTNIGLDGISSALTIRAKNQYL